MVAAARLITVFLDVLLHIKVVIDDVAILHIKVIVVRSFDLEASIASQVLDMLCQRVIRLARRLLRGKHHLRVRSAHKGRVLDCAAAARLPRRATVVVDGGNDFL